MLTAGQIIDRYRVEAELGRGACAVVYRVRHTMLGSLHALKLLQEAPTSLQQRLVQEGQIQATMRHPNVVAVTDIVDVEGVPGLIVEYIEGPSLEQWLRDHRPDLVEAEALFRDI